MNWAGRKRNMLGTVEQGIAFCHEYCSYCPSLRGAAEILLIFQGVTHGHSI